MVEFLKAHADMCLAAAVVCNPLLTPPCELCFALHENNNMRGNVIQASDESRLIAAPLYAKV